MLIISSNNDHVYSKHREIWLSYMNSYPNINCYFIEYRHGESMVDGNTLYMNGSESYSGIIVKTINAFDHFLQVDNSYDYIVRTNLSSLWNFDALLKFLSTLPKTGVYSGITGYHAGIRYVSGSGIIMTPDVVKLLIEHRNVAENVKIMDDVDIGYTMTKLNIPIIAGTRVDILNAGLLSAYKYDDSLYHYRVKWERRDDDIVAMKQILDKIRHERRT